MEVFGIKIEAITKIIRELAVTSLLVIIAYKLLNVNPSFDFTKLSATDLVALILAVFAVGLSAAFYFAASNSSSKFYDNMHKFTKDTSVILGQLTEQLKGLDKRQQEVKETFERQYSSNHPTDTDSEVKVQAKEIKVNEVREDLKNSVESWLEKFQIEAEEREKIKSELAEKESLLSDALTQLSEYKAELREHAYRRVRNYLKYSFRGAKDNGANSFQEACKYILDQAPDSRFKIDLEAAGLITSAEDTDIRGLTEEGLKLFTQFYEKNFDN
ncbi:hypothetical protein [uncultured Pseudoalteromonas sp.]|uniref:hypothetical protein n=1 Tax=uncultured Pseudoalteromonas sp. TaxID=114053 RepID=UPI0032B29F96